MCSNLIEGEEKSVVHGTPAKRDGRQAERRARSHRRAAGRWGLHVVSSMSRSPTQWEYDFPSSHPKSLLMHLAVAGSTCTTVLFSGCLGSPCVKKDSPPSSPLRPSLPPPNTPPHHTTPHHTTPHHTTPHHTTLSLLLSSSLPRTEAQLWLDGNRSDCACTSWLYGSCQGSHGPGL